MTYASHNVKKVFRSGDGEAVLHKGMDTFAERLDATLAICGLNQSQLALKLGISRNAVSAWKNNRNGPGPKSLVGAAKILRVDLHWLATGEGSSPMKQIVESFDPDSAAAVGGPDGRAYRLKPGAIAEIDVRAGMGGGGYASATQVEEGDYTYAASAVRAEWVLPSAFVRNELHVAFGQTEILLVAGDSMEPDLRSGDRVVVDRSDTNIRQGGIFAVVEDGQVIVKQVELVRPVSDPPAILITSRNGRYAPYTLDLDGSNLVVGRVAGKISRM